MRTTEIRTAEELKTHTEKSVLAYCTQAGLFPLTEETVRTVCVAVSGGADSMALLHILLALAPELQLRVSACHVNHGMRGAAADRDEAFVSQQCALLGVPLTVYSATADAITVPDNAGEDWARKLRYGYFEKLLESGVQWIATAHTGNDQAETLLFRLARGTGAHGAAGIRPKRGAFVRPLLCLSRQDTEAYCAAAGQSFVTDETNLSVEYARNRIRRDAIPALEQVNTAAVKNLRAFCDKMDRIDVYFFEKGQALLQNAAAQADGSSQGGPWDLDTLRKAEPLILESVLHQLVSPVRDAEQKYICLLEQCIRTQGAVQLLDTLRFAVRGSKLYRETLTPDVLPLQDAPEYPMQPGEYHFPGGYCVKISVISRQEWENIHCVHKKDLKNLADYARIPILMCLRTRHPGDRFHQAGRCGSKSLKKLYNEEHIPPLQRSQMPLAAQGEQVLWLWGHGFCEGLAPDEKTEEVLFLQEQYQEEDNP